MKKKDKKALVRSLRMRIFGKDLIKFGIALLLLIIPIFLAASSIWLNLLAMLLDRPYCYWIINNLNTLNSLFGVIAGSYLTIYATYFFEKKKENKKNIGIKELAFYKPMSDELAQAYKMKNDIGIWKFDLDGRSIPEKVQWTKWKSFYSSEIKYIVPKIFRQYFIEFDNKIKNYNKVYNESYRECEKIAKELANEKGFKDFMIDSSCILENVYTGKSSDIICFSKRDIEADTKQQFYSELTERVKKNGEYVKYISCADDIDETFLIIYNGIDYMLNRIYSRYNGRNILL